MSNNPAARMAAIQLDEAARRCEEAAHLLSMAPSRARGWVEQMVSGVRAAEPAGSSRARRAESPGGSTPIIGPQRDEEARTRSTRKVIELSTSDLDHKMSLNSPPPNSTIRVDEKFTFETDELGRVIRASAILDVLDLDHPRDPTAQRKLIGKLPGDHAGHIFARIFRGPIGRMNLIPMEAAKVNLGQYAVVEKRWRKAIENGEQVEVSVDLGYGRRRDRPDIIVVYHKIGSGKRLRVRIRNVPKAEEE
ncbi:DNA/RNA non-specific endonuclease [Kribbella ginsengisoli]